MHNCVMQVIHGTVSTEKLTVINSNMTVVCLHDIVGLLSRLASGRKPNFCGSKSHKTEVLKIEEVSQKCIRPERTQ